MNTNGHELDDIDWDKELYGRGYLRIDWARDRHKKRDFWTALDGGSSVVALMVDWHWIFGSAVDALKPFLELTGKRTDSFPCPAETPCECRHAINETSRGELVAACCCDHNHCRTYQIEPEDLLFHGIGLDRFGEAIRRALGLNSPSAAPYVAAGLREIGTYAPVVAPVYLSVESAQGLLRELTRLVGLRDGPFLVLTPTGGSWTAEIEAFARPHGGGHISLSSVLNASATGLISTGSVDAMLAEFGRGLSKRGGFEKVMKGIRDDLRVIAAAQAKVTTQQPAPEVTVTDGEARRVFSLMKRLEGNAKQQKAALGTVFRLTVLEGHSQGKAARLCGCAPSLMSRRVKTIESRFGKSIEQLRNYASAILEMEASVKGDKRLSRKCGDPRAENAERPDLEEDEDGYLPEEGHD